jgi:hypothetical protein
MGASLGSYLIHLEELVALARRLRREMRDGDGWKAGWMLLPLVAEWARTRQQMLRYCEYDPSFEQRIQEIAAEFVTVLTGREQESEQDDGTLEGSRTRGVRNRR